MRAYRVVALDPNGKRVRRLAFAADESRLRDDLLETQLHPLSIRPAPFHRATGVRLSQSEAARFARDLARLVKGGMSVGQALGLLAAREAPRPAAAARLVRTRLTAGEPLSSALTAIGGSAAAFLQALARAGEVSGRQADILAAGGESLAATDQLRQRMLTLSLYPSFVIAVAVGSVAVYAYAVLPALEPAFAAFGDDIPLQTRLVLRFGQVTRLLMPTALMIGALFAASLLLSQRIRRTAGNFCSRILLRLRNSPVRDYVFANLASRLAVMLEAGVPLTPAWRLAIAPITTTSLVRALEAQDNRLMEGAKLSSVFADIPETPPDLIHHVMLGEQTGRTAQALAEAAKTLDARARESVERMLSMLTPLVIVVVGVLVGMITMMVFQGLLAVGDAVDQ